MGFELTELKEFELVVEDFDIKFWVEIWEV